MSKRMRTLTILAASLAATLVVAWFVLTSPAPLGSAPAAPTAEQVGAGRDAYRQLRGARGIKGGRLVLLGPAQLDGVGALASHGFRPDRLKVASQGSELIVEASHRLPLGRWLNVTVRAQGPSRRFPKTRLKIGALSLSPLVSRWTLELGRWMLRLRRADVPALDDAVRDFSVRGGMVIATISLPGRSGLIDSMAGAVALPVDSGEVVRIYCALAERQRKEPSADFAEQVRRAFMLQPAAGNQTDFDRAAFVALGALLVDQRVADFADGASEGVQRCRIRPILPSIYGRRDWPAHWALSAAIAAGAGVQLSEAVGEWKELADSLARRSQFAAGDPSGFSMADLAADRAGFRTAQAAVQPDRAEHVARQLAGVTPQQLLPHALIEREDGLTNAEFVRRYGGVDDPRFKARVAQIDGVLDTTGLY
jgi:hypothetical protein